jgi:peptidoglycan/LPS O-acetylase OafA/YrhL
VSVVQRLGYQPALDGVRGIAIALVVCFHAYGYPRDGYLGVDLFFVLSGFLITRLLLEEHARRGEISLRSFYLRRALRLGPALLALTAIVLAVAGARYLTDGDYEHFRRMAVGSLGGMLYVGNFVMAFVPNSIGPGLFHLWSLATEEQFYLLWPPVLSFLLVTGRRRLALPLIGVLVSLSAFEQVRLVYSDVPSRRYAFAPDSRSSSILIGCAFALAYDSAVARRQMLRLAKVGAIVVGFMLATNLGPLLFIGPLVLFGVGTGTVVVSALEPDSWARRALSFDPLVSLGRLSYSLYLWHLPVLVVLGADGGGNFGRNSVGIAVALAVAALSYRVIEQPFRRRREEARATAALAPPSSPPEALPAALSADSIR